MRAIMEVNQHLSESIAALSEDVKDLPPGSPEVCIITVYWLIKHGVLNSTVLIYIMYRAYCAFFYKLFCIICRVHEKVITTMIT